MNLDNHPLRTVKDLLDRVGLREVPTVGEEEPLHNVTEMMSRLRHSRVVFVVDEEHRLVGAISLGMLAKHRFPTGRESILRPRHLLAQLTTHTAADIMERHPLCTRPEEDLLCVRDRMLARNVKEVAVVDHHGHVLADLTMLDLLHHLPEI